MQPWAYGMPDHGNLLGTVRSLDLLRNISLNCTEIAGTTEHDEGLHCAWGLVSRSGWALLQDHDSPILPATQWFSPRLRHSDSIDAYLFAHGTDYRRALRDYTAIGGRIPLLPRYAAGPWYTRWYDFDSSDVGGIVRTAESLSLPMDVFMFDMNWHQKYAWGGYSWDRRLFPDPADTLAYLRCVCCRCCVLCAVHCLCVRCGVFALCCVLCVVCCVLCVVCCVFFYFSLCAVYCALATGLSC